LGEVEGKEKLQEKPTFKTKKKIKWRKINQTPKPKDPGLCKQKTTSR